MADKNSTNPAGSDTMEFSNGDFILLTHGNGTQAARILGTTPKRIKIVRCAAYRDAEGWGWRLGVSMISKSDNRIVGAWEPTKAQRADAPADVAEVEARFELAQVRREIESNLSTHRRALETEAQAAQGMPSDGEDRNDGPLGEWMNERCDCDRKGEEWFHHRTANGCENDRRWARANGGRGSCAASIAYRRVTEKARKLAAIVFEDQLARLGS